MPFDFRLAGEAFHWFRFFSTLCFPEWLINVFVRFLWTINKSWQLTNLHSWHDAVNLRALLEWKCFIVLDRRPVLPVFICSLCCLIQTLVYSLKVLTGCVLDSGCVLPWRFRLTPSSTCQSEVDTVQCRFLCVTLMAWSQQNKNQLFMMYWITALMTINSFSTDK